MGSINKKIVVILLFILFLTCSCREEKRSLKEISSGKSPFFSFIKDDTVFQHLFKEDIKRESLVLNKSEKWNKLLIKFLLLSTDAISKKPDSCSFYALRAYIAALTRSDDMLFKSLDMIEKFNPRSWATNLLIAYIYYQKWEDDKAIKYLDKALNNYCKEGRCVNSNAKIVVEINKLKKRIKANAEELKYDFSKTEVSNIANCYFMELNGGDEEKGRTINWSGKCNNGFAEGKGVMEFSNDLKYEAFYEKGYLNGNAKITWANGSFAEGRFTNGVQSGEWCYYKNGKKFFAVENFDSKGRYHGKTAEWMKNNYIVEMVFKHGVPTRDIKAFQNKKEVRFTVYRNTQKRGRDIKFFSKKDGRVRAALERFEAIMMKDMEKLRDVSEKDLKKNDECSIEDGFNYILKESLM